MTFKFKFTDLQTKSKVLVGVGAPLVLLMVIGGISLYSINKIVTTNGWVQHTNRVLASSSGIIGSAVDMETGMRGYLLAGQEGFLDPYISGEASTFKAIDALQETVNDNPAQVERLNEVRQVLQDWQANVHRVDDRAAPRDRRRRDHERHGPPGRRGPREGCSSTSSASRWRPSPGASGRSWWSAGRSSGRPRRPSRRTWICCATAPAGSTTRIGCWPARRWSSVPRSTWRPACAASCSAARTISSSPTMPAAASSRPR